MGNNFNIDGNAFISSMIEAGFRKQKDEQALRLKRIFDRYNIPFLSGVAMLVEIVAAFGGEENDN